MSFIFNDGPALSYCEAQENIGETPDIKSPTTLSEKICHRLVYDHNNVYTMLADKLAVREYVSPEQRA
jgi:hypothetical protein